jgi:TolB-like protein
VPFLSLFDELKRRNVFRVAIAYTVIAWILAQVADLAFDNFGTPVWVSKTVLFLLLLGFPLAIFFAWAFELTPEGLKKEKDVDREASITSHTGRKLDYSIIVLLVIALGYFVWESRLAERAPAVVSADASVAVLAFENMSPDPENAFFAEGISEEILNVLAAVDGLRVASRTSAFSFADSDTPIPEIASQLDVAHILEGSVRKQGMRVRITAQLIDAASDTHLWSESYDRNLDDIFAVQEEIAIAISEALMGALGMGQITVSALTDDMAAYELFLRGRQQFYQRGVGPLESAIADLQAAVSRDPEFAEAWSYLAASFSVLPGYKTMDAATAMDPVRSSEEAAGRALALDPNQALAVAVQGHNAAEYDRIKGLDLHDRAVEMAPDHATILMWAGNELFIAGAYLDEALPLLERAYRLDPLSGINNGILGIAYISAGQRELGYHHVRRANELGWVHASGIAALDLLWTGETDAAIEFSQVYLSNESLDWTDDPSTAWDIDQKVMRREISSDELAEVIATTNIYKGDLNWSVYYYQLLGDYDRMFDAWLAMDYDYAFLFREVYLPSGRAVMEHPRMIEVAEKQKLFPLWESKGYPFGCERVQDEIGDHLSCPNWPK